MELKEMLQRLQASSVWDVSLQANHMSATVGKDRAMTKQGNKTAESR
jgi:hypothetical protein